MFVALMLSVGDTTRSIAANGLRFLTFGEVLKPMLVGALGEEWASPAGRLGAGLLPDGFRVVLASPASMEFAVIAAIFWLMRWGWRKLVAANSGPVTHVGPAKTAMPLARGSPTLTAPIRAAPNVPPATAQHALAPGRDSGRQRTVGEAPPAPTSNPLLVATTDRDFLPASLEILLTPPSPAASALVLTICGAFFAALAWSYFGWIDIHAVALGKVQPSGRSKVMQPLEAGKVVAIRVENGATVNAGDVLLELDPTETGADREVSARDVEATSAEAARRTIAVAISVMDGEALRPRPVAFDAGISEQVRRREEGVLAADLGQLRSVIASLKAQLAEKLATKQRLRGSIDARQKLIALSKERVDMCKDLESRGAGSRALIIESLQQYENYVTSDAGERGQLIETDAAVTSLERKIEEARTQFVADQTQKLAEAERRS